MDLDDLQVESRQQRRILAQVLALNVFLSSGLVASGVYADSSGLMANALDNASDSAVYATVTWPLAGRLAERRSPQPSRASCYWSSR